MLTIQQGDMLVKFTARIGARDAQVIRSSAVIVESVAPCTCAPHHALVTRPKGPPVCVDLQANNVLALPLTSGQHLINSTRP